MYLGLGHEIWSQIIYGILGGLALTCVLCIFLGTFLPENLEDWWLWKAFF